MFWTCFCVCAVLSIAVPAAGPAMAAAKPHSPAHVKPAHTAAHKLPLLTTAQLARLVLPSVVSLTVLDASGQPSVQGSGFVIGPNLIATNIHVIRRAHAVTANFQNGRSETVFGCVAIDSHRDLALLYANTNGVRALPLMTNNTVQVGDSVIAVGSPEGYGASMSTGIISQIRHDGDTKYLQTTAPISHGSSGGALVDMYGRVLGVTSFFNADGQNLNFAYASYYVQRLVPHGIPTYTSWAEVEEYTRTHPTQTAATPPASAPAPDPDPSSSTGSAPSLPMTSARPSVSDAADNATYTDNSLAGLTGVAVIIEDVDADAQKDGIDAAKTKKAIELKLRAANIKVFDKMSSPGNKSLAALDFIINTDRRDEGFYAYSLEANVLEVVQLKREVPTETLVTTWNKDYYGTVGMLKLTDTVDKYTGDEVDAFIKDYLAQNPK